MLLVHVRQIGLAEIIEVGMLGVSPVKFTDMAELGCSQILLERLSVPAHVMKILLIVLPPVQHSYQWPEILVLDIIFDQRFEIGNGHPERSAWLQQLVPSFQGNHVLPSGEVLEHGTGIDDIYRVCTERVQELDVVYLVNSRDVPAIDIHIAIDVLPSAPQMQLQAHCAALARVPP